MKTKVRITCAACGRKYRLNLSRGHSKTICNSCSANRYRIGYKQKCVDYLGGKCKKCGYNRCILALHAHHRDPTTKLFGISTGQCRKWAKVVAELNKCDLLCSNCHAEEHATERWQYLYKMRRTLPERDRINWPTKQKLQQLTQTQPLETIAKRLGVSGVAVKKRCKKLGITTHGRGYWAKQPAWRVRNSK